MMSFVITTCHVVDLQPDKMAKPRIRHIPCAQAAEQVEGAVDETQTGHVTRIKPARQFLLYHAMG